MDQMASNMRHQLAITETEMPYSEKKIPPHIGNSNILAENDFVGQRNIVAFEKYGI